jgi:hypothetical protein
MTESEPSRLLPYGLWKTKRMFPNPLLSACVSLASLIVGVIFAGVALHVPGCWPMGAPSAVFFAGSYATARATFTRRAETPALVAAAMQTDKPTFAIFVLLISVYTWMLTLAIHLFEPFFKHRPGSLKYNVTLGLAIGASLFVISIGVYGAWLMF